MSGQAGTVWITGFGPFTGVESNPTASLARRWHAEGGGGKAMVLDVACTAVDPALDVIYTDTAARDPGDRPCAVVHLGVDSRATAIRVEVAAYNECDFKVPDQDGYLPHRKAIDPSRPLGHRQDTRVDVEQLIKKCGVPSLQISKDPGRFLCNYIYYKSIIRSIESGIKNVLFVHVPPFEVVSEDDQYAVIKLLLQILIRS